MFTCRGCKKRHRDKDLGAVVSYSLSSGEEVSLLFCWSLKGGCWVPTMYYMAASMTPEERKSITNVRIDITNMYMQPEEIFKLASLEELFKHYQVAFQENPFEKIKFCKTIEHYQKVGLELAKETMLGNKK